MKIGFDAKRAFGNRTGLGNYSRYVLNILSRFSGNIIIRSFTPRVREGYFDEYPENQIIKNETIWPNWLWRSFFIKNQLKKEGIEIYHGLTNEIPNGLKHSGIKTVVTIHDLIFLHYPAYYPFFDRLIYAWKFKYACQNADKIIAISERTKQDIVHFFGVNEKKIEVIYQSCFPRFLDVPTVDFTDQTLKKYKISKRYLVCVGTIEERKNQMTLAKAFQRANPENAELIFIGRGKAYKDRLKEYIENTPDASIRILENVDNDELLVLYRKACFAAYVSVYEGFGIPVLEAMSAGKAVLAAKGSCLEEAGGEGAVYVNPSDVEAMSEMISNLFEHEDLRNSLIEKGERHLAKFDDKQIAMQLERLYQGIMQKG